MENSIDVELDQLTKGLLLQIIVLVALVAVVAIGFFLRLRSLKSMLSIVTRGQIGEAVAITQVIPHYD